MTPTDKDEQEHQWRSYSPSGNADGVVCDHCNVWRSVDGLLATHSHHLIDKLISEMPESKEYPESTDEPTFVDISATGAVTGYNQCRQDILDILNKAKERMYEH